MTAPYEWICRRCRFVVRSTSEREMIRYADAHYRIMHD